MRDTPLRFWPKFARLFKYVLLAVLLTLTVYLSMWWKTSYDAEERMRFEEYTEEIVREITGRLHNNHMLLKGAGGLLANSNEVTLAEWKGYCDYRQLNVLFPGILGLGFSQVISPSDLARHIQEIRAAGYPDYTVWPAGNRDTYTSIIFLEPFDAINRQALGYDMFSEPVRRAAMERARDTGEVAISGLVQLVQKDGTDFLSGVLMYLPIYAGGIARNDVEGRRANLKGYVYAPIRLGELIQKIFPELNKKVTFEIYDGTEISSSNLLYSSTGSGGVPQGTSKPRFSSRKTIEIYGSRWTLIFACQEGFLSVSGRYTLVSFLITGFFLSLFAFLFLRGLEKAYDQEISMAQEKTTALEQSEAKYRALADSLSIGVSIIGPQMEVLAANATTHKWFPEIAVEPNSLCSTTCGLPPKAKPCEWCPVALSFSDSQTHTLEREVNTALGKRILFFTASPLFDSDGKVGSVHLTAEDITERRQAEKELNRAQRQIELILNSAGEGIYGVNSEGKTLFVNPKTAFLLGYAPEEMVGQRQHALIHHTRADGTPYPLEECPIHSVFTEGGARSVMDEVFWRKDGTSFPVDYTGTAMLDDKHRPIGAVVVFRDVTDRRKTEKELSEYRENLEELVQVRTAELSRLSQAIKQSPVSIVITNRDAIIEYVNPIFTEICGYTPEEALGKNPRILQSGEHTKEFYQGLWKTLMAGNTWNGEFHNKRKDGSLYWERACISPLRDDKGVVTHYVAVKTDITERKRVEEALVEAKKAADAANRAKSSFLANMSHEIRTPMNAILGFAQILERDHSLSPLQAEHVRIITRSGNHLLALINDILDISKIEAGAVTLNPSTFCLVDLLNELETLLRSRAAEKGLQFLVEQASDIPRYVVSDENKLRQILLNLIGNAIKFSDRGCVTVRMLAEPVEGTAAMGIQHFRMIGEVEDTGPGIADEDIPRLFGSFQQAEAGAKMGGTGLGLAISRGFARLMGGDITVASQVGKGSCFRLHVLLEAVEAGAQHKKPALKRVVGLKPGTGPFRILVADDIMENRALLLALLGPLGFEVKAATNGAEAIDIFQAWSPHLVLMDMRMPVLDGYEAIRQLKAMEMGRAVPVIAITASAFEDNVKQVMETGADGYLRKPFLPEELFAQLEKCHGLHYVFAEEHDESLTRSQPAQIVTANLPHKLLEAMRQAVADGDMAILTELIARVAKVDSETARGLQELADRYEYGELAEWLAKGEKS